MAQRRLSLELDLDSGSFTAKMRGASGATEIFHNKIDQANDSLRRLDRGVNGATSRLRDFTLVMGNLRSAVENARFFLIGMFEAAVSATAEIERTTFLLRGLSKEASDFGRRREAQENLEGLIETAKQAPFSLKALSDTFVKFRAGGLDPTNGSMNALLDAVAAFGGSDELLHRASIAIQQMGGKGVISMEELRQQLGEAVPTAIALMAKGLGMSYDALVKQISLGKVKAAPALAAMFEQFELAFGGSAQRMMETYRGRVAQLQTSLMELAMAFTGMDTAGNVRDGSFYDYLKKSIEGLTDLISSDDFKKSVADIGAMFGEAAAGVQTFASLMSGVKDAVPAVLELKQAIGLLAFAIMGQLAGRAAGSFASFVGDATKSAADGVRALSAQEKFVRDYRAGMLENARIDKAAADAAVSNSARKVAALQSEKAALQSLIRDGENRIANANRAMATGRGLDGRFMSRAQGQIEASASVSAVTRAKQQLAAVDAQLTAAEHSLTAAQVRQTAATKAQTAAVTQSTIAGRMKLAVLVPLNAAVAAISRGWLIAATGARTFTASILALSTAQGRYNALLAAGNALLVTMRGAMLAGTVAARGLMIALGFFGGPLGIAIMGVAAAIMSVAGAINQAKDNAEKSKSVMEESNAILNRMAAEGILAADSIKSTGDESAGAAEGVATVGQAALSAATNLREYAAAAREAAIAEIDLQIAKAQGAADEARSGTSEGAARNVRTAQARRSGANGQRTGADWWHEMGERWDWRVAQLSNWWTGGASEQANREALRTATSTILRLQSARASISMSPDSAYEEAWNARNFGGGGQETSSTSGGGRNGQGQSPDEMGMGDALRMLERVQGIEAEIAGAGKEAAKLAFMLDHDPEMASISADIRDNMMAAAEALDLANARMEGFRAFESLTKEAEEQEEAVARMRAEIDLVSQGLGDAVVENARYRAGLSANVRVAEQFTDEAETMADRAARAQREYQQLEKQRDAMVDIQRTVESTRLAAIGAWDDYTSGLTESNRELSRFRRGLAQQLALIPEGTKEWVAMKAAMDAALDNFKMERAAEALMDMNREVREIARSFMPARDAARDAFMEQDALYRSHIENIKEGTAERARAEADYYAWRQAKELELASQNPIAQWAMEGVDVFDNLQRATTGWVDSLIDGLAEGKLNFKEFASSMLKEIAKIILKAMVAKYILQALGLGAPMGGGGGGTPADIVGLFHTGGIVGSRAPQSRKVDPSMFYGAPKLHSGGIAGLGLKRDEVPAILKRKEGVFTPEQMAALAPVGSAQAAPNVQVNVINQSGQDVDAQQSGNMRFDGRSFILDVVIEAASKPGKMRDALKGVGKL